MAVKTKPNYTVLSIGGLFLVPPAWVVFQGVQNLAGFPPAAALFTVGGLAALSVVLIYLGLQNLEAGDAKDARVQFIGAGVIMIAEFTAQWWFAIAEHHALVTSLVLSMLAAGGALVIESEIMRVWKANGRSTGLLSLPRAQVPAEVRRTFPEVAVKAHRLAVRYPNATQESILALAFAEYDQEAAAPAAAQVRVDVHDLVKRAIGAGNPPADAQEAPPADDPRSVSALVREGIEIHGADAALVSDYVLARKRAANAETVRKTVSAELKLRSA
jgi:hypothetical protein